MGFQTNVSFLNDHFDWIEKNPQTFVKAIKYGMNHGTESLGWESFDWAHGTNTYERTKSTEEREAAAHYVTVHPTQHADVPQVIFTHRNSAWSIYDLTRGIETGILKYRSNPDTYCEIAKNISRELRRQAKALDKAVKDWEEKNA